MKFICRVKDHPEILSHQEAMGEMFERHDERVKFIKRMCDQMDEEVTVQWKSLWELLKALNLVEATMAYEDYVIQLHDDKSQIFINKKSDQAGMPDFLKKLLT